MSLFICPNCGHESHIFSHGGARNVAAKLGMTFLGELPLDIEIRETSDAGQPIVVSHPDSPNAQIYLEIARKLWDQVQGEMNAGKAPPRIVMQ